MSGASDELKQEILDMLLSLAADHKARFSESSANSEYIQVPSVTQAAANSGDCYAVQAGKTAMSFAFSTLNSATEYVYSFGASEKAQCYGESESLY